MPLSEEIIHLGALYATKLYIAIASGQRADVGSQIPPTRRPLGVHAIGARAVTEGQDLPRVPNVAEHPVQDPGNFRLLRANVSISPLKKIQTWKGETYSGGEKPFSSSRSEDSPSESQSPVITPPHSSQAPGRPFRSSQSGRTAQTWGASTHRELTLGVMSSVSEENGRYFSPVPENMGTSAQPASDGIIN